MPNCRRAFRPGGTYFFTVVTERRRPLVADAAARQLLREAFERERIRRPFLTLADVLLSNHLHVLWQLPPDDADFATRWRCIKQDFTQHYLATGGEEAARSASRHRQRQRGVWQKRYWE